MANRKIKRLRIFLSHRYESPQVNLYFFDVFRPEADFQFEVDDGWRATCVTRLERMVRSADAFVGLYPFPESDQGSSPREQMKKASRYFRLEMDLAMRSGKPALVFYDKRYGTFLKCPSSFHAAPFDWRETLDGAHASSRERHRRCFKAFLGELAAFVRYQSARIAQPPPDNHVVVISPPKESGLSAAKMEIVLAALRDAGCTFDEPRPPQLSLSLMGELKSADWVVTDVGPTSLATGIPAFLHGQFCPSIRMLCARATEASPLETHLFHTTEVGYSKDIVRWEDADTLQEEFKKRLALIKAPSTWIASAEDAQKYFRRAAQRKETVFLSYSGKDREIAAKVSDELKKRFQNVFDYRDGRSIATGKPWIEEVFQVLANSRIGIPLLSANYFATKNCVHEAQQMVARADQEMMVILPVKIATEDLSLPEWLQIFQYARYSEYSSATDLVQWLLTCFERNKPASGVIAP